MNSTNKIKIAVVHDDFIQFGGAEKLILDITNILKSENDFEIEIFSSLISDEWKEIFRKNNIQFNESFLKNFPFCYRLSKVFFIFDLFYFSFQSFNFENFDIVFSSSTRFGQSVITKPKTFHISYINSPARALWDERRYFWGKNFLYKILKIFLPKKRVKDFYTQNYADLVIANSKNIKWKIYKNYKIKSIVVTPFIDIKISLPQLNKENYFVLISRLVSWKNIDFVIDAFNRSGQILKVIGVGQELERLKKKARPNIEFLGYVSEKDKLEILSKAQSMIFQQNEDFGLTLIESLLSGTPIIYYNKGGAKEILNETLGTSFDNQNAESLLKAIEFNKKKKFNEDILRKSGLKYTSDPFRNYLIRLIKSKVMMKKMLI